MRNKANQQIKVILVHLEKRLSLFYNGLLNLHQHVLCKSGRDYRGPQF